jgi:hypothetical protein
MTQQGCNGVLSPSDAERRQVESGARRSNKADDIEREVAELKARGAEFES